MAASGKCGWVGTGTGIPSVIRSRPLLPDPFPTLVSVLNVYRRPDLRHLVPVRTVSRPAVRCTPDFSSPAPSAQLFPSHPDGAPSRNSLQWQMFLLSYLPSRLYLFAII